MSFVLVATPEGEQVRYLAPDSTLTGDVKKARVFPDRASACAVASCEWERTNGVRLCEPRGLVDTVVLQMPPKGQSQSSVPRPPSSVRAARAALSELHGVHTWGDGEIECHGNLNRWQLGIIVNALTSHAQTGFPEGDVESEDRCNALAELFARILREG